MSLHSSLVSVPAPPVVLSDEDERWFAFGRAQQETVRPNVRATYLQPPAGSPAGTSMIHIRTLCAELSGRPRTSKDRTVRVQEAAAAAEVEPEE